MSMFSQPAQGDRFDVGEHTGSLCLFFVHDVRQGIMTSFGEKEAVACDIHVLDGNGAGEISHDALIFQGALIGSLRSKVGAEPVLARISTGVAKPGQKPPYILTEYTAEDAAKAEAYLTERARRFQGTGNGDAPKGNGAASPAAATPSAATASPATGNGAPAGTVDLSTLPPEVQELLKQTGAVPR